MPVVLRIVCYVEFLKNLQQMQKDAHVLFTCSVWEVLTTTVTVISDEVILRVDPGTAAMLKFMT